MLTKAFRSVLPLALALSFSIKAEAGNVPLTFNQLDDYARAKSARAEIIGHKFGIAQAERARELQWSNPELSYDREDFDMAEEYQFTVSKSFEFPWSYLKKRSGWNDRVESARLKSEQEKSILLFELRSGYVKLRVLDDYLGRLGMLREILTDASHVASDRHTEGHLSGVEEHLIQMSVISLNAGFQELLQRRRELASTWRASIGLSPSDSLVLSTPTPFIRIELQSTQEYAAMAKQQPAFRSRELLGQSLSKLSSSEKGKFIPSLNLYGGYKKIEPDLDGYVAGVSIEFPIFNRNGAAAKQLELESRVIKSENALYFNEVETRIGNLVKTIRESQHSLGTVADHFEEDLEALNSLVYSYEEGWMTLNEFLNAIQIEVTGLKDYYSHLINYYEKIFQLEAITGTKLVTFEDRSKQ